MTDARTSSTRLAGSSRPGNSPEKADLERGASVVIGQGRPPGGVTRKPSVRCSMGQCALCLDGAAINCGHFCHSRERRQLFEAEVLPLCR